MKIGIILLTKSHHEDELRCWLHWHLDIIGFDVAVVYDNESTIDVRNICNEFNNRVSYKLIKRWPNQHSTYNHIIKENTDINWCIALDDDEYLYIGDKFNCKISDLINYLKITYNNNMYYIMWLNMFSHERISSWDQPFIYTHTYYSYEACKSIRKIWPQDNSFGKTLIDLSYRWDYLSGSLGHIPRCVNGSNKCITVTGEEVKSACLCSNLAKSDDPENCEYGFNKDCFIAHFQFKTFEDWRNKCFTQRPANPIIKLYNKVNVYDELYKYSDSFKECTLLKDRLENSK